MASRQSGLLKFPFSKTLLLLCCVFAEVIFDRERDSEILVSVKKILLYWQSVCLTIWFISIFNISLGFGWYIKKKKLLKALVIRSVEPARVNISQSMYTRFSSSTKIVLQYIGTAPDCQEVENSSKKRSRHGFLRAVTRSIDNTIAIVLLSFSTGLVATRQRSFLLPYKVLSGNDAKLANDSATRWRICV